MSAPPRFREQLWASIEGNIVTKIESHPFITGLVDGTLSETVFGHYIAQDKCYLDVFARMLNVLASKAPQRSQAAIFTKSALAVYDVEMKLHDEYLKNWGIKSEGMGTTEMQPTCLLYVSYLQAVVPSRPFHEGLAAVLPCYWIYLHVGKLLKRKGSPNAMYQAWIDMYGGDEFESEVTKVLDMMDDVISGMGEEERQACIQHFITTSRMEYMFWDGPYRGDKWPC